jgi:hypothetical protein
MFLLFCCMHFEVWEILRTWSPFAPTTYEMVHDCRKLEKQRLMLLLKFLSAPVCLSCRSAYYCKHRFCHETVDKPWHLKPSSGERKWTIYVTFVWSGRWMDAKYTVYQPRRTQSELLLQWRSKFHIKEATALYKVYLFTRARRYVWCRAWCLLRGT